MSCCRNGPNGGCCGESWCKPPEEEVEPQQTVREQLAKALAMALPFVEAYPPGGEYAQLEAGVQRDVLDAVRAAIERANREPEETHDLDTCIEAAQEAGRI